jgi:hypothetical protein
MARHNKEMTTETKQIILRLKREETKYICLIVLAPDFMTKFCKKAAQDFHPAVSKVFDRVKSVALWPANIRKLAKDHKGYRSAAKPCR